MLDTNKPQTINKNTIQTTLICAQSFRLATTLPSTPKPIVVTLVVLELVVVSASVDLSFIREGGILGGGLLLVCQWARFVDRQLLQHSVVDFHASA